jgi:hypothetical protein
MKSSQGGQSLSWSHSAPHTPSTQYWLMEGGEQSTWQSEHEHDSIEVSQVFPQSSSTVVESRTLSLSYSLSFMPAQKSL